VCGFRQEAERDGELDFVLCFGPRSARRCGHYSKGCSRASCPAEPDGDALRAGALQQRACGHLLDRSVVRQRLRKARLRLLQRLRREAGVAKVAEPSS